MGDWLLWISVVTFFTVMAVPSVGIVATLEAHAPAFPAGELVEFHVKPALAGVEVTVARYMGERKKND